MHELWEMWITISCRPSVALRATQTDWLFSYVNKKTNDLYVFLIDLHLPWLIYWIEAHFIHAKRILCRLPLPATNGRIVKRHNRDTIQCRKSVWHTYFWVVDRFLSSTTSKNRKRFDVQSVHDDNNSGRYTAHLRRAWTETQNCRDWSAFPMECRVQRVWLRADWIKVRLFECHRKLNQALTLLQIFAIVTCWNDVSARDFIRRTFEGKKHKNKNHVLRFFVRRVFFVVVESVNEISQLNNLHVSRFLVLVFLNRSRWSFRLARTNCDRMMGFAQDQRRCKAHKKLRFHR